MSNPAPAAYMALVRETTLPEPLASGLARLKAAGAVSNFQVLDTPYAHGPRGTLIVNTNTEAAAEVEPVLNHPDVTEIYYSGPGGSRPVTF